MKNLAQKVSEKLLNLATVHAKNMAAWADALTSPHRLNLHSKIGEAQK